MADEPKPVQGSYHVLVDVPEVSTDLLFYTVNPPTASLEVREFKTWDANGNPVNSIGGGRQVTWGDVTLSRGVDKEKKLWGWFKNVMEKGVTKDTKKVVTIKVYGEDVTELMHTWTLNGAVITQYSHSASNAQTQDVLVENVTLKYESATLDNG